MQLQKGAKVTLKHYLRLQRISRNTKRKKKKNHAGCIKYKFKRRPSFTEIPRGHTTHAKIKTLLPTVPRSMEPSTISFPQMFTT